MANWFPIGKSGANTNYASKEACELAEGQECFDVSGLDRDVLKVVEVDIEVGKDELGNPIVTKQKQVVEDSDKKSAKDAEKAAKDAKKASLDAKLAALKQNGHKDVKDLIEILGL